MQANPSQYQQLQPEDRMTIASLRQQNFSIRAIARQLDRSASTVQRELVRNSCASGYESTLSPGPKLIRRDGKG
jgi:IS30 family transposase